MRRRDFLKATAVGAGATILDGCGPEETQYIVQQVRNTGALPGESVWVNGVCRQCAAGCGIRVRVVDGNAKKIEGNEAHPVGLGGVCALGHSVLQELYNPDRILQPRRLSGARGEGAFDPVSWDEAIGLASGAIGAAAPGRVAILGGSSSDLVGALLRRLADAIGAPAPAFLDAPELEVERLAARIALGTNDLPSFEVARAEHVLSIGAPLLDRWRSPVHYTHQFASMRRGRGTRRGRLIQAEARMSLTAANADVWLPVRPGTEGVLSRALGGYLLENGASATAAAAYRRLFPGDAPSLSEAAEQCDVREDRLLATAEELAASENAVVVAGGSAAAHTNGVFNVTAALALNLLLDNLGRPGGVYAPANMGLANEIAPAATSAPAEVAARIAAGSVDVLLVAGGDPLHQLPAGWGLAQGLAGVGTVISLSSFLDDTTLQADLVLPVATELERFEAVEPATSVGLPVLGMAAAVVEPMGEARHPGEIVIAIATAMGGDVASRFDWSDFEEVVETVVESGLARMPGGAGADAGDYFDAALEVGGAFGQGGPAGAPSGPSGAAPAMSAATTDGSEAQYPFQLLPFESLRNAEGRGANRPWMQEMPDPMSTVMWNSWIELSPHDAEELGIHTGDVVSITSPTGSVQAHALLDPSVRPGVVCMPTGHGHQAFGRYAEGRGANVQALVGSTTVEGTAAPAWAANRVRVERVGEGELITFGRKYEDRGAHEVIPVGWAPHDTTRRREASV